MSSGVVCLAIEHLLNWLQKDLMRAAYHPNQESQMPPQPTTLVNSLAGLLVSTINGTLTWEAVRHPEDGEVMFYKAQQPDGEFINTIRLNPEEEDGGPSLSIAFGEHPLDPDDELILRDHLAPHHAQRLTALITVVQGKT